MNLLELLAPDTFADSEQTETIADDVFDKGVDNILAKYSSLISTNTLSQQTEDDDPLASVSAEPCPVPRPLAPTQTETVEQRQDDPLASVSAEPCPVPRPLAPTQTETVEQRQDDPLASVSAEPCPVPPLVPTQTVELRQDDFVATLWHVEGVGLGCYLGMVTRIIPALECETCKVYPHSFASTSNGPCFMVRSLELMPTSKNKNYKWAEGFDEWHCIHPMLITKVTVIPVNRRHYSLEEPSIEVLSELMKTTDMYEEMSH